MAGALIAIAAAFLRSSSAPQAAWSVGKHHATRLMYLALLALLLAGSQPLDSTTGSLLPSSATLYTFSERAANLFAKPGVIVAWPKASPGPMLDADSISLDTAPSAFDLAVGSVSPQRNVEAFNTHAANDNERGSNGSEEKSPTPPQSPDDGSDSPDDTDDPSVPPTPTSSPSPPPPPPPPPPPANINQDDPHRPANRVLRTFWLVLLELLFRLWDAYGCVVTLTLKSITQELSTSLYRLAHSALWGARSIFDTLHRVRQFTPPAPKLKFCSRLRAHAHEAPLDVVPFIQEQLVENEPYLPLEINSISDHIQVVNARSGLCLLLFNLILVVRVLVLTVGIFFRWWFNDKEEVGRVSQVEDSALENPVGDEISESEVVVVGSFESDVMESASLDTKAADDLVDDGSVKDVAFVHSLGEKKLVGRHEREQEREGEGEIAEDSCPQDLEGIGASVSGAVVGPLSEPDLGEEDSVGPQETDGPVDTSSPKDMEALLRQYPFSLITPEGPGSCKMVSDEDYVFVGYARAGKKLAEVRERKRQKALLAMQAATSPLADSISNESVALVGSLIESAPHVPVPVSSECAVVPLRSPSQSPVVREGTMEVSRQAASPRRLGSRRCRGWSRNKRRNGAALPSCAA